MLLRCFMLGMLMAATGAWAADAPPAMEAGGQMLDYAKDGGYLRIAVLLTILSFIPALLVATTAFTRIVIVLSAVRLGLGMQEIPSNIVIITLALFLSAYVMTPVARDINELALKPYLASELTSTQFLERAAMPLEKFMLKHTRQQDLQAVERMAAGDETEDSASPVLKKQSGVSLGVLIPAFMLSELRVAFQMAFMVLLPFLLVDLIVSVTLMALGMMMVPPITISLPLKILMFVLVDGWIVIARSLVSSFAV